MLKRIVIISTLIILAGCAGNQRYATVVQKGFKRSKTYELYKEKVNDDFIYYKRKKNKGMLFFFLKKEDEKVDLYLSIKYRGKNWMYMSKIEFEDENTGEKYLLDFYEHKLYKPLWKDRTTISLKVEEYLAFPLTEEEAENIAPFLASEKLKITYYSDYDDRKAERILSEKDRDYMKEVYEFYLEMKKGMEEKALHKLEIQNDLDEYKEKFEIDNEKSI
jgi:hypothetical protein